MFKIIPNRRSQTHSAQRTAHSAQRTIGSSTQPGKRVRRPPTTEATASAMRTCGHAGLLTDPVRRAWLAPTERWRGPQPLASAFSYTAPRHPPHPPPTGPRSGPGPSSRRDESPREHPNREHARWGGFSARTRPSGEARTLPPEVATGCNARRQLGDRLKHTVCSQRWGGMRGVGEGRWLRVHTASLSQWDKHARTTLPRTHCSPFLAAAATRRRRCEAVAALDFRLPQKRTIKRIF